MKQSKLLLTSALVGSVALAGSAFADISGDITTTIQLGSDDGTATSNGSDERIGSEVNIKYKSKVDLDNGMTAGINGKLEFQNGTADQEYEMTIGTDSAYLGIGSDGGNSIRSSALPFLGYVPGTLAEAVSTHATQAMDLLGESEASEIEHLSLNAKAAGGTFTFRYAPKSSDTKSDAGSVDEGTGGSRTEMVYSGSPVEGLKVIIGQNIVQADDDTTNSEEETVKKIGVSYNFGQFAVGAEQQKIEDEDNVQDDDAKLTQFAATFAASDKLTIGLTYSESEDEDSSPSGVDEEITTFEVGYNLGGMNIIASYVSAEGMSHTNNQDADGLVLRTSLGF
jgi:hypothetical protein